jgi:hypothetical protein
MKDEEKKAMDEFVESLVKLRETILHKFDQVNDQDEEEEEEDDLVKKVSTILDGFAHKIEQQTLALKLVTLGCESMEKKLNRLQARVEALEKR